MKMTLRRRRRSNVTRAVVADVGLMVEYEHLAAWQSDVISALFQMAEAASSCNKLTVGQGRFAEASKNLERHLGCSVGASVVEPSLEHPVLDDSIAPNRGELVIGAAC